MKSVYAVDRSGGAGDGHQWGILVTEGQEGMGRISYYDSDGTLERSYSAPGSMIGRKSVGGNFFTSDLRGMERLVARYNAVNGEDFMVIAPAHGRFIRTDLDGNPMSVYMKSDGVSDGKFQSMFRMNSALLEGKRHWEHFRDAIESQIVDEADRERFRSNPSAELAVEIFDKQSGIDGAAIDTGCHLTYMDVYSEIMTESDRLAMERAKMHMTPEEIAENRAELEAKSGVIIGESHKFRGYVNYDTGASGNGECIDRVWAYQEDGQTKYGREVVTTIEGCPDMSRKHSSFVEIEPEEALRRMKSSIWSYKVMSEPALADLRQACGEPAVSTSPEQGRRSFSRGMDFYRREGLSQEGRRLPSGFEEVSSGKTFDDLLAESRRIFAKFKAEHSDSPQGSVDNQGSTNLQGSTDGRRHGLGDTFGFDSDDNKIDDDQFD